MRHHRNENHHQSSADRIRRRMRIIEEERRNARPKINPFTLISIFVILILALIMSNLIGGYN